MSTHQRWTFRDFVKVYWFSDGPCLVLFFFNTWRSQTLLCIRLSWKTCKIMQVTSPSPRGFGLVGLGKGLRIVFSKKDLGGDDIASVETTLWEPLIHNKNVTERSLSFPSSSFPLLLGQYSLLKWPSFYLQGLENLMSSFLGPWKNSRKCIITSSLIRCSTFTNNWLEIWVLSTLPDNSVGPLTILSYITKQQG